ncbi:hypothetical protein BTUL_0196g00120 [Botrytis tulipae]|uniref:Uncharacterized protein n=1 Tax=Botrytis tulipae TaxID=87230 RepID=A0A4Z1EHQ9_9HELO|nr:hypothetical protein BTUL_0196g00120 [Botrytis tulipae]
MTTDGENECYQSTISAKARSTHGQRNKNKPTGVQQARFGLESETPSISQYLHVKYFDHHKQ